MEAINVGLVANIGLKGKEFRGKYQSIPGNYGIFYQNIFEHLRMHVPLFTDASEIINVIRVIKAAYRSQTERAVISFALE